MANEMKWLPIETAPKDGTRILVLPDYPQARVEIAKWRTDEYAKKPRPYFCWSYWQVGAQRETQPKYWMPLPSPPEGT